MKRSLRTAGILFALMMASSSPAGKRFPQECPPQEACLPSSLDCSELTKRGLGYRCIDKSTIEITDECSGFMRPRTLREPSERRIRSWADTNGIPLLEINPALIDTTQYAGWYNYWTEVPLSQIFGLSLVVGDIDNNGRPEVYGIYKDFSGEVKARVYEIAPPGQVALRYEYLPWPGVVRQVSDVDRDGLKEMTFSLAGVVSGYEQPTTNVLPIDSSFRHDRLAPGSSPIFSGLYFGDLDKDAFEDFLYNGSEVDSADTTQFIFKTYAAEYRPTIGNFVRVWSKQFYPPAEGGTMGYPVADFDNDQRTDFMMTNLSSGYVFVAENAGNDQFIQVWSDSTPFVNFYYQGEGDVDADGRTEFFGGATMSTGNWTILYETDGNNRYSPKFLFHLLSAGLLDSPIYLTRDVDHDGRQELVILSGNDLYIFKSRTDNRYYLWYLKRFATREGVQLYDFNGDKLQDFIVSKMEFDSFGRARYYSEVFLATSLVAALAEERDVVPDVSLNCYPNPFNSHVTIQVKLQVRSQVDLRVYNLLGQEVAHPVHETKNAGVFTLQWSAEAVPSGVYLCRINTNRVTAAKKILLLR